MDLILADFAMPGMNGAELAEKAWAMHPYLPVLFATGYADAHKLPGELSGGHIINKPYRIGELSAKIRLALAQRPVPGGLRASPS